MLTERAKTILRMAFSRDCLPPEEVKVMEEALRIGLPMSQLIDAALEGFMSSGLTETNAEIRAAMESIAADREGAEKYVAAMLGLM